MKLHQHLLFAAATLVAASSAHAAIVTWGSATLISGDSNVSTNGSFVEAVNFNGSQTTVNGVTFGAFLTGADGQLDSQSGGSDDGTSLNAGNFSTPDTLNLNAAGTSTFTSQSSTNLATASYSYRNTLGTGGAGTAYNTLNTNFSGYAAMMGTGILCTNTAGNVARNYMLTLGGLTAGNTYEVQFFMNDSRAGAAVNTITAGNSVNLDVNSTDLAGGVGQWVIGSFIADAGTQNFSVTAGATNFSPQLNAYQLRDVSAVPEPSTYGLMGAGALAAVAMVRRRRKVA